MIGKQVLGFGIGINQTTRNYDVYDYWVGLVKGSIEGIEIRPEFSIYSRTNFFTQSSIRIIVI